MTAPLFCDECGTVLPAQALACSACGYNFAASSPPPPGQAIPPPLPTSVGTLPPRFLLAHRYQILHQIGQGGFATVYKAKDRTQKNKVVAIKQITVGALSLQEMIEVTDAYNREVTHLSKLRHANLPRIYDHFTDNDHWYVVMEYIQGNTLEEILQTRGFFPVKRVLNIGITLCRVLHYLHTQRPPIIFRDVKPTNIMVTRTGHLYLIDFGIARYYQPGQVKDTGPLGSPGYAAPEQYGRRSQTTPQTDVYGLGATLQTLLTGKEPLELLATSTPPERTIPQELQDLLTRMLERDVRKRPQNMNAVKQKLERLKDRSFTQKIKHFCAFSYKLLKSFLPRAPIIFLMLLSLAPLFSLDGFLKSPFWTLYLFIAPCIILGHMALAFHQTRVAHTLNKQEALTIVGKHLWSSLLSMWIVVWTIGIFFYTLSFQSSDHSILELAALACIIACIALIVYWGRKVLKWLGRTKAPQSNRSTQSTPLPLQVHKHP